MITNISGLFLYLFSVLVYRTCKFSINGFDNFKQVLERKQPVIITSWHGMTMMIAALIRLNMDFTTFVVIVPDDLRGDVLQVFSKKLGAVAVPLNLQGDSTFETGKKLVRLVKKISKGKNFMIHPDGPAGPAYKVKPGLSFIAAKSGALILPVGCYCRHAYHVPRWDRYTLPLPFSKVQLEIGNILSIPEDTEDLGEYNLMLENELNRLTVQASGNYYPSSHA